MDLLSPAGNWDCARAAVENGANAIYFGLGRFNARLRAANFTEADLPELMAYLHRHGVRGYVTFNTLIFTDELADAERSLAHALVGGGLARVGTGLDDPACTAELLSRERVARTQRLGLWGEPDYAMMSAEDGAGLLGQEGRFAVVEGKVASVRESGGTIYMNFGRRWSQALTVTIPKRQERSFAAAGLQPDRLANLRLRVRGYIEERAGPRIEATRPEQIEIAQGELERGK